MGIIDPSVSADHPATHLPDVIRPTVFFLNSVNQRLPSGPAVIPSSWISDADVAGVGSGNKVLMPEGVMRPIALYPVNQRLPSGPVIIPSEPIGFANLVLVPEGVTHHIA